MKVAEAVEHMTKWYLERVIDSFAKDFPRLDEDRARDTIVKNVEELTNTERIKRQLSFQGYRYGQRVLQTAILEALLDDAGHAGKEDEIVGAVVRFEEEVLADAENPDSLKYEDDHGLDILKTVLDVALEDDRVSEDELRLLQRLREKLGIQERSKRILLARLGHFPRSGNAVHTPSEFRDALNDLQRCGVVFYCNHLDGGTYLIPDEIVPGVKQALGIELSERSWTLLLEGLSNANLSTILEAQGLPKSGSKGQLVARVMACGVKPSEALDALSSQDLYDVCRSLPGANVSGSKGEKAARIIEYFAKLVVKDVRDEASPAEVYYQYLVELAHRDRENLLTNRVIKKDRDMEWAFEEGLRYLFSEKLGLELLDMPGSDHPDGCMAFPNGDLFMWDAKSKEDVYTFPASHAKQFKRYIRDSAKRVSCFMVIVPGIGKGAEQAAARLKVESKTDTDVALIAAADLLWVVEQWNSRAKGQRFDLEVFNITAALSRPLLDQRTKLFV